LSLKDIKIPADASDRQTTEARSALPPVDFSVSVGDNANVISITDRQGVQNRLPTAAYRVYFLPYAVSPTMDGLPPEKRLAAQKVSNLVTEIAAPGRGTVLTYQDTTNFQQRGTYFCVSVNRSQVETNPENIVPTDSFNGGSGGSVVNNGLGGASAGGGGIAPVSSFTKEDSSTAVGGGVTVFTFSTTVAVNDVIVADGLTMDEAFGDYTRAAATVTMAIAPINTMQRIY
jgi:hypothetical protein